MSIRAPRYVLRYQLCNRDNNDDFDNAQIKTGVEGKNVAFLFTDTQIVVETMLEDLNNVLNSGEIPNLFPQDEQVRHIVAVIHNKC